MFSSKQSRCNITSLVSSDGRRIYEDGEILTEILKFYKNLLGTQDSSLTGGDLDVLESLLPNKLNTSHQSSLISEVTREEEVIAVNKSMPKNKSPGPDGYRIEFFLSAWEVFGDQMVAAILEFFQTGKL